jgi:hypothetical protein
LVFYSDNGVEKDVTEYFLFLFRIKGTEEALKLFKRYDDLMEKIKEFKKKYFHEWTLNIPKIIESKANNSIIARQGSDLILNFSPMVSKC